MTRDGAALWQISVETLEKYKEEKPEIYHRVLSRIAVGINRRLKVLSKELHRTKENAQVAVSGFRLEHESLGQREISDHVYYGVQKPKGQWRILLFQVCMSSGSRCGLNEINLPAMQPGSSIMPGKVNIIIFFKLI